MLRDLTMDAEAERARLDRADRRARLQRRRQRGARAAGAQSRRAERARDGRHAAERAGDQPEPRLRPRRDARDEGIARDVQRVGSGRVRRPAHDRRQLSRLRADVRAVAASGGGDRRRDVRRRVRARFDAPGASPADEGARQVRDLRLRQLLRRRRAARRSGRGAQLVHLLAHAALRHELLRAARPHLGAQRGVLARSVRAAGEVHVRVRARTAVVHRGAREVGARREPGARTPGSNPAGRSTCRSAPR